MSEAMLHSVLNMPPELWDNSELDKIQRHSRYMQASRKIEDLTEELRSWIAQYGCACGHPSCSVCKDTTAAQTLIEG